MLTAIEPLRDVVGRVLYEEPGTGRRDWYMLSEERREPWRSDADLAFRQLADHGADRFAEYAAEIEGVDWLAVSPAELFREFFLRILETQGPK